MIHRFQRTLQSRTWQHIGSALLSTASFSSIIWAIVVIFRQPCLESTVTLFESVCSSAMLDLAAVLVAACFWSVGLALCLADQLGVTLVFFLLAASAAAAGKVSILGGATGARLFHILLAWLAPVTFHFHHTLLTRPLSRADRILLALWYGLAAVCSSPLILMSAALQQTEWLLILERSIYLGLAFSLALTALVLIHDFRHHLSPVAHRHIRLIAFGNVIAIAPLILLSLLPQALGAPAYLPFELTVLCLLISPLTYGFSFFRHRLVRTEVALNRMAGYFLLITLLLSVYLSAGVLVHRLTGLPESYWPLASTLFDVGLLLLFARLQRGLQQLTHWALYGNEFNYINMVGRVAESLSHTLDREMLRRLLLNELASAMRASRSALFLKEHDDTLILLGASGFERQDWAGGQLPGDGHLAAYLESAGKPVPDAHLRRALAEARLQPQERVLCSLPGIAFWLPLISSGALQGLLLMGARSAGDYYTAEDERILATLAHQSGVAAYNVRLTEQFRAGRQELARAHQQLLIGREQERRELAHELHDDAVQQLLGINYQLAGFGNVAQGNSTSLQIIQQEVLSVITQLRRVIGDLRPAGLEEFGLTSALKGYVTRLQREGGPELPVIELDVDKVGTTLLPSTAICLFRVAQEGLRNSLKHAQAHHIKLKLRVSPSEAILSVRDDGRGFCVPARLSELAQADHFGLLGMAERVSWAGGQFVVHSRPGLGTEITSRIPLNGMR